MPKFRTVLLDCDSTLSEIEGIDELAVECREDVARLTELAMRGQIPLEEVYGRRLQLVQPTRAALEALGRAYVDRMVPDARETIACAAGSRIGVRGQTVAPLVLERQEGEATGTAVDESGSNQSGSRGLNNPLSRPARGR